MTGSRAIANNIAQRKSDEDLQNTFVNNRQDSQNQLEVQNLADQYTAMQYIPTQMKANDQVIQRAIDIGWEPTNPANYRNSTTAVGNGVSAPYGGVTFGAGNRTLIHNSNYAAIPNNIALTLQRGIMDDDNNRRLISRGDASYYSPEVDHIVPRLDGGANSLTNGRLLAKGRNTAGQGARPNRGAQTLKAFQALRIRVYDSNGPLHGDQYTDGFGVVHNRIRNYNVNLNGNVAPQRARALEIYRTGDSANALNRTNINGAALRQYHGLPTGQHRNDASNNNIYVRVD